MGRLLPRPPPQLDLRAVYAGEGAPARYRLRSLACFHGHHYSAFVLPEGGEGWVLLDDAQVRAVGDWAQVLSECEAGNLQPSVLFFASE